MATQKANKETGLTVFNIPSVLEKLNAKLASLEQITGSNYKSTAGVLEGSGVDIQKETKIENLIRAYGSVLARETAFNNAAQDLNISKYPVFKVNNGSAEDIKHDVKLRIAILEHADTVEKLKGFKQRTQELMTKEDQQAILLKEINNFLG